MEAKIVNPHEFYIATKEEKRRMSKRLTTLTLMVQERQHERGPSKVSLHFTPFGSVSGSDFGDTNLASIPQWYVSHLCLYLEEPKEPPLFGSVYDSEIQNYLSVTTLVTTLITILRKHQSSRGVDREPSSTPPRLLIVWSHWVPECGVNNTSSFTVVSRDNRFSRANFACCRLSVRFAPSNLHRILCTMCRSALSVSSATLLSRLCCCMFFVADTKGASYKVTLSAQRVMRSHAEGLYFTLYSLVNGAVDWVQDNDCFKIK